MLAPVPSPYELTSDQVLALACLMRKAAHVVARQTDPCDLDRLDLADDLRYCAQELLGTNQEAGWVLDTLAAGGLPIGSLEELFDCPDGCPDERHVGWQ